MNHSARTFIFVGLIVVFLLALHFLPKLSIGTMQLRRVNVLSDILPEVHEDDLYAMPVLPDAPQPATPVAIQPSPADSSRLARGDSARMPSVADMPLMPMPAVAVTDSSVPSPAPVAQADSSAQGVTPIIDYSQGQPGGMYHFYQALAQSRQLGRPVRVAYYGDSFIEGDIFTADLRQQLQDQFGGNGVGWVDCASQVHGFRTTVSHNFSGINEYEVVKRPFSHQNQGIAQRYFTVSDGGGRITLKGTKAKRHLDEWDRAIFYLRTGSPLTLRTTVNADTTLTDTIPGSQNLQAVSLSASQLFTPDSTGHTPRLSSLQYNIGRTSSGTLLYGVALEPASGVVVDNFSMRGSAGYTLQQIPDATLAQFAAQRPYDLIVVHFGLNVANSNQGNYSGYTRQMGQAIDHLHQAYPQASILVVSMPDRDQRTAAGLRTMKGVEQLVAYQQIMASDHGVSFFNLFEAMGGRESMKQLVDQGLANKDYTHINFRGGRQLADLLFQSLMAGYHSYGF